MIKLFKRKKKAKKDIFEIGESNLKNIDVLEDHEFITALVYASDAVNTIYPACASCYNISPEKNTTYEERLGYIGRRVKTSHTSILEHSNVLMQVFIPLKETENLFLTITNSNDFIKPELCDISSSDQDIMSMVSEVRDACRYLTIHTDTIDDEKGNPIMRMTIGGSIRGYRYIFENIKNRSNRLFVSIFNTLKLAIPQEFFIDFINDGVMENYSTIEITKSLEENVSLSLIGNQTTENIDIINRDNLVKISKMLGLDLENCFDFVSITVDIKHMSRIITQQLTRHRNGITQESQRYVNYENALFNSPAIFKDKYDSKKKYTTLFGEYTMEELGQVMSTIYKSLVDQGVEKEDARGYLPQNIQCGKLFMTFNLRTLVVFLNLRLDPHAQAEINKYAHELSDLTEYYSHAFNMSMKEFINKFSKPSYYIFEESIDEEV